MPFNIQGTPISDPAINEILQKFKSSSDGQIKNSLANNNIDNWQEANSLVNPDNNRVVDEGDLTANNKNLKEKKLTSEDLYTLAQFFLHRFPENERKSGFDWVFLSLPPAKTEQARVARLLRAGGFQAIWAIEGTTFFQKIGEIVDYTGTKVIPRAKKIIQVDAKGKIVLFDRGFLSGDRLPEGRGEFQKILKQPRGRRTFQEKLKKIGYSTITPGVYYREEDRFGIGEALLMEENGELLKFAPAEHDPITEEKWTARDSKNSSKHEQLIFEGVKEIETLAYDKASATIKREPRSVMVYRNSSIENYYDWQAEDGKPSLKLIQQRLLRDFSSQELGVRSFPEQISNSEDLKELAAKEKSTLDGEPFFGEVENIDPILMDDSITIKRLGLTRQAVARGLMYFVNLYYYLQLRQIGHGNGVSTIVSYKGQRFLLSGNSYLGKEFYFSDGTKLVSDGEKVVVAITNITDPKKPQKLLCAGVIARLIGTHGFFGGKLVDEPHKQHWGKDKSFRIPPARAALVLGILPPAFVENVVGSQVLESPEDLDP